LGGGGAVIPKSQLSENVHALLKNQKNEEFVRYHAMRNFLTCAQKLTDLASLVYCTESNRKLEKRTKNRSQRAVKSDRHFTNNFSEAPVAAQSKTWLRHGESS